MTIFGGGNNRMLAHPPFYIFEPPLKNRITFHFPFLDKKFLHNNGNMKTLVNKSIFRLTKDFNMYDLFFSHRKVHNWKCMMKIQRLILPSLAFGLLLATGGQGAPNGTKSSFFPSTQFNVDINRGGSEPYIAEASEFFPDGQMKQVKFPGSQPQQQLPRQQSINSAEAQLMHMQHQQQQHNQGVVIPLEQPNTDEAAANEAIDVILSSARTGKNLNLAQGGEELVKVASDPVIKEQLASGNEAEARGYIRNKLCSLGLMPVSNFTKIKSASTIFYMHINKSSNNHHFIFDLKKCDHHGPVEKQGLLAPGGAYGFGHHGHHHGHGHGHGFGHGGHGVSPGWGPGIPAKDVALVQPVALKPVGHPIAAVPLDHHKPIPPGLPLPGHHHRPYGNGKVYGHPPLPPKPIYRPPVHGPPPPPPGHTGIPHPGKPVIEHVHHHIHHQPTVHHHGPPGKI